MNHTAIQWCAYSQPQSVTAVAYKRKYDSDKIPMLQKISRVKHEICTNVTIISNINVIYPKPYKIMII